MKIIDKFNLYPMGGYCTCFSHPYSPCRICNAVREQQQRWDLLTPRQRKQAHKELEGLYPGYQIRMEGKSKEFKDYCQCGAELIVGWPNGQWPPFDR